MKNPMTKFARELRAGQTDAEARLWYQLRNRQFEGLKFRRQHQIGEFIADFCCEELHLIVELDGGQHADAAEKDGQRTIVLEDRKYLVLRFWNTDVLHNMEGVLEEVLSVVRTVRFEKPLPKGWPI